MRTCLLLAALATAPACDTSNAQVPDVDREAALQLVLSGLDDLERQPDATHWHRTYRQFDRHLEPHLPSSKRLGIEVAFGALRRDLKMAPPEGVGARIDRIRAMLQPQD
jgi:hypothetical protein